MQASAPHGFGWNAAYRYRFDAPLCWACSAMQPTTHTACTPYQLDHSVHSARLAGSHTSKWRRGGLRTKWRCSRLCLPECRRRSTRACTKRVLSWLCSTCGRSKRIRRHAPPPAPKPPATGAGEGCAGCGAAAPKENPAAKAGADEGAPNGLAFAPPNRADGCEAGTPAALAEVLAGGSPDAPNESPALRWLRSTALQAPQTRWRPLRNPQSQSLRRLLQTLALTTRQIRCWRRLHRTGCPQGPRNPSQGAKGGGGGAKGRRCGGR